MVSQKKVKMSTQVYSSEEIDKILKSNPPVYASGKYYVEMSKKFKISIQDVKNRCVQLGLINIFKEKI